MSDSKGGIKKSSKSVSTMKTRSQQNNSVINEYLTQDSVEEEEENIEENNNDFSSVRNVGDRNVAAYDDNSNNRSHFNKEASEEHLGMQEDPIEVRDEGTEGNKKSKMNPKLRLFEANNNTSKKSFYFEDGIIMTEKIQNKEVYSEYLRNIRNKFFVGMILNLKRWVQGVSNNNAYYSRYHAAGGDVSDYSYDRFIDVVDVKDPALRIYRIIFTSPPTTTMNYIIDRDYPLHGSFVAVFEPTSNLGTSFDDTTLAQVHAFHHDAVKYISDEIILNTFDETVQDIAISDDAEANKMRFFKYQGVEVKLSLINFQVSCAGRLCGRCENIAQKRNPCFCISSASSTSVTMFCQVHFKVNTEEQKWYYSKGYKSCLLSIMNLFISSETQTLDFMNRNKELILDHIENEVKRVNENGGWNVYGWYRKGEKGMTNVNAREVQTRTKVSSTEIFPHISKLIPFKKDFKIKKFGLGKPTSDGSEVALIGTV